MFDKMSYAFVLDRVMEPLAALVRVSPAYTGLKFWDLHEKVMLYADDMMLFLGDTTASVMGVMTIISSFVHYSGLTINWTKSALLVLDEDRDLEIPDSCPIPVVTSFKYLGIQISPRLADYCSLNVYLLLSRFQDKINTLNNLKLSLGKQSKFNKNDFNATAFVLPTQLPFSDPFESIPSGQYPF